MNFLVRFALEFDLTFEISRWEKSGEIFGEDFSTCQESTKKFGANFGANFGTNFGENFGNFVSKFVTFFRNVVQQKGGANHLGTLDAQVTNWNHGDFKSQRFEIGEKVWPGVLWKKAPRAIRAMRGKTLQIVPFKGISTVLWVHQKLPQSTVSQAFPSNKSYESKAGCNRTPATVLWAPLIGEKLRLSRGFPNQGGVSHFFRDRS